MGGYVVRVVSMMRERGGWRWYEWSSQTGRQKGCARGTAIIFVVFIAKR